MHGKNLFGPTDSMELTEQVGILQMVIFSALKRHLGSAAEVAQTTTPGGGPVIGWMAAGEDFAVQGRFDASLAVQEAASPGRRRWPARTVRCAPEDQVRS